MKRKLALIMTIVMGMALISTGCGSGSGGSGTADGNYTIGISQFGSHASLDNCREGFLAGLAEEGIVEGKNLTIDLQNAQFDTGTASTIAQSFVSNGVDMICAIATPTAQAAFNAAEGSDIPVVFTAVTDPVAAMLTEGNITGTSDALPVEAQLKMIRALMPEAKTIGIMYTTSETNSASSLAKYKELAGNYGFEIVSSGISQAADVPMAADDLISKVDCISNLTDNTVVGSLAVILEKANAAGVPVFGSEIEQVKLGCVASEGIEYVELGKQTGRMAAKILKGEAAADIPYETIANSNFYFNGKAAALFGIKMPDDYAARAELVTAQ